MIYGSEALIVCKRHESGIKAGEMNFTRTAD